MINNSGQGFRDLIDEIKASFDIEGLCRATDMVPARVSTAYKKNTSMQINLTAMETEQVSNTFEQHAVAFPLTASYARFWGQRAAATA